MTTSFVFLGDRNYNKILNSLESLNLQDFNVFFLTNKKTKANIKTNLQYKILTFDQYSTQNEMLEYFFQNESYKQVFVVKASYQNLNLIDFEKMLKQASKKDVIISKQNKEQNVILKFWQKIKYFYIKYLFGFKLYSSEADIVYLSSLASSIIKQSPNRSARFINTNCWSGIDVAQTTITEQPKIKTNKISNKCKLIAGTLVLFSALLVCGNILLSIFKVNIPYLAYIAYIMAEIAIILFSIFYITKIIFFEKHGKLNLISEAILVDFVEG